MYKYAKLHEQLCISRVSQHALYIIRFDYSSSIEWIKVFDSSSKTQFGWNETKLIVWHEQKMCFSPISLMSHLISIESYGHYIEQLEHEACSSIFLELYKYGLAINWT